MTYTVSRGDRTALFQLFTSINEEDANRQYREWASLISNRGDYVKLKVNNEVIRSWKLCM